MRKYFKKGDIVRYSFDIINNEHKVDCVCQVVKVKNKFLELIILEINDENPDFKIYEYLRNTHQTTNGSFKYCKIIKAVDNEE